MGKVVTSQGLNEFVQSGKFETVIDHKAEKPKEAPALEVKKEQVPIDVKPTEEVKQPEKVEDDGLEADDIDLTEHVRKKIGKKHRQMMEAKEEAAEADRLAEAQFNRARLAEQKLVEIESENQRLKAEKQVKAPELKEPNETDPEYQENGQFNWRKFTKAQADYAAAKAVAEFTQQQEKARLAAAAADAEAKARERISKAEKEFPDYKETLEKADVKTHTSVLNYLTTSPMIGEISYYLAKNPEFVERINKLDPWSARDAVVELATILKKPEPKPAPQIEAAAIPPAPISPLPLQASVNTNTDPAKMSYKELRAYERSRRRRN
jgi:hypothetical protein